MASVLPSNPGSFSRPTPATPEQTARGNAAAAARYSGQAAAYTAARAAARAGAATSASGAAAGAGATRPPQGVYDPQTLAMQQYETTQAANRRNTASLVAGTFEQYGLGSLASKITEYAQAGMSADEIAMRLRQTPEYQKRFAAMPTLAKRGRALSEAEYIGLEQSYSQVLKAAGLPAGFYDSADDFGRFIANDVSPQELADRAARASELVNSKDPAYLETFQRYYGVGKGDLAAYFLDPGRAMPLLEKAAKAAQVGAEAVGANLDVNGAFAETLVDKGIGREQARQAFGAVAEALPQASTLAAMDRQGVTGTDLVNAGLGLDSTAEAKVKGLASRERARFSGSNAGTQILGRSQSGSF